MLVVAGCLEGFFSPSHAPVWLKFTVGGLLFTLLLTWLFRPVKRFGRPRRSDGMNFTGYLRPGVVAAAVLLLAPMLAAGFCPVLVDWLGRVLPRTCAWLRPRCCVFRTR